MGERGYMFDRWKLADFAPGQGIASEAFKERFDDDSWLDIPAPGDVHRTLIAAGRIDDPFYDRNEEKCAWMEEKEWWYRLSFEGPRDPVGPDERLRLIFHGLDTFTTVWLNGEELGEHANMFREAAFDVTDRLKTGESNTLALCFHRPLERAVNGPPEQWGRNPERVGMRKAQFGYGWDWGPRLPTVGIWRPVELRRERRAALRGVHFYTLEIGSDREHALVAVKIEADNFAAKDPLSARIELAPPGGGALIEHTVSLGEDRPEGTGYLKIEGSKLWWTHDLGEPSLYDLQVALLDGEEVVDSQRKSVGIRTLELDQSPDPTEPGTRFFRFVLNGIPIFARGADWIPADSFVGEISDERYERLLASAKEANMNMLRVWGGGIYEHDVFYDLCDRLGILVWQDFMFACATYPEEPPAFVAEIEAEARYQVRRLRSHPCLALWCGNNENQWIHDRAHPDKLDNRVPGALYYDEVLPKAVADLDGQTAYWPGSPYGGSDHNDRRQGNVHNWEVWHGNFPRRFGEEARRDPTPENVSYLRYAEDRGRFISEFGMHASPVMETLRRTIPRDQLYHHSPSMDHHNKDEPKNKGDNLMLTVTGLPNDLDEYVDYSMIAQAEGLKFAIEHFRRRKPHCSGTLFWQLNDCWPVLSWSVLDYYGFGKAGYYYARRAYSPILASFKYLPDSAVELWITNDTLSRITDTITVRLGTFAGEKVWEESCQVEVGPNESHPVRSWSDAKLEGGDDSYLWALSSNGLFPPNRQFFTAIKDLLRKPVRLEAEVIADGDHRLSVRLRADQYSYFVYLTVPDETARYTDNYFDMEPNTERTVVVENRNRRLSPETLRLGWR
jgi:beta-mannosidase